MNAFVPIVLAVLSFALPRGLSAQEAAGPPIDPVPLQLEEAGTALTAAIAAAESWLDLIDAGEYGQGWQAAAPQFRDAIAQEGWEERVAQVRTPLEPFSDRTLVSAQVATHAPGLGAGEYVVFQYVTAVSGDRRVVETVSLTKQSDGTWQVVGYFVRPPSGEEAGRP